MESVSLSADEGDAGAGQHVEPEVAPSECPVVVWACQVNGVTDLFVRQFRPADRRPSKVISKAFNAAFHRLDQRLRPRPVGSKLIVVR